MSRHSAYSIAVRHVHRQFGLVRPYINRVRYELVRPLFNHSGEKGSIGRKVTISSDLDIEIGAGVALRDGAILAGSGVLKIGDGSTINSCCIVTSMERVEIGKNVLVAPYVYILDVDHKFSSKDIPIAHQGYSTSPVMIEDDVWLGSGVVVTKGAHIGRGAIIGANSVVRGTIPEWSVAAGAPAIVKRWR